MTKTKTKRLKKKSYKLSFRWYFYLVAFVIAYIPVLYYNIGIVETYTDRLRYLNVMVDELQESNKALIVKLNEPKFRSVGIRTITMYTSRPEETDDSPCIGSSMQDQCVLWRNGQNICATNEFLNGEILKIEGLGECLVMDAMNKRYPTNVDWYNGYDDDCLDGYDKYDVCPQLKEAINFGAKNRQVELLIK